MLLNEYIVSDYIKTVIIIGPDESSFVELICEGIIKNLKTRPNVCLISSSKLMSTNVMKQYNHFLGNLEMYHGENEEQSVFLSMSSKINQ